MKFSFLTLFLFLFIGRDKPILLKHQAKIHLSIPEPSDICLNANNNGYWIVSDNGKLFETDLKGEIIKKAKLRGFDFEAVYASGDKVYVMEEMTRTIIILNAENLEVVERHQIPYSGGRNKGFESLTWNPVRERYVIVTERDPVFLYELNKDFQVTNQLEIENVSDISAATFAMNHLWLLSDEDHAILKLDPQSLKRIATYSIPVLNPEGICFYKDKMMILSDDLNAIFQFLLP